VPSYLAGRGLRLLEDIGSIDYRARYLGAQGRHLRGYAFYRVALARVEGMRPADPGTATDMEHVEPSNAEG
jgi:hypothetical protein